MAMNRYQLKQFGEILKTAPMGEVFTVKADLGLLLNMMDRLPKTRDFFIQRYHGQIDCYDVKVIPWKALEPNNPTGQEPRETK